MQNGSPALLEDVSLQQQCQVYEWRDSALCCATVRRLARDLAAGIIRSLMLLLVVLLLVLLVLSLNLYAESVSTGRSCTLEANIRCSLRIVV
jgi:hypothetical protein